MQMRWVLGGTVAGVAVIMMTLGVVFDADKSAGVIGLLGNVGAELLGLAATVAIIDWLIERKKYNEQVQRLAWQALHDIDHAFWVWQGGRREFHLDELFALLNVAEPTDPLPAFTEEMFINLGIRSSDNLRLQPRLMEHDRRVKAAFRSLAGLAQMREAKSVVDQSYLIEGLRTAVTVLAEVTGQRPHLGEFTAAKSFRDPSEKAQQLRYRGSLHESIARHSEPMATEMSSEIYVSPQR
ncbi:MAG: hypothetical protein AAF297_10055 [Planctomycetota bacterium]